ncbi:hypothetical protein HPB52_023295 [Rhipicephalus sanguineus]|uniref:Uncharacterized protein n=1 Tax=Rhipicephalus sanguineus TaxID=34632 RepID=A0A9D4TC05_RHISA|nr:hypothetical protein HPB52_023295 [Rhipicephalus sanguineus]
MIAPSRFQPFDQLDEASNSQPADLTIHGPSRPALLSDTPANNPAATGNQVAAATTALRKRVNKPHKPAAPYSSLHCNASGKMTQKAPQSQEQNFPSLESDHQTLTP